VSNTLGPKFIVSIAITDTSMTGIHTGNGFTANLVNGNGIAYLITNTTGSFGAVWDQSPNSKYAASTASFTP
jgi:hypothetical protein